MKSLKQLQKDLEWAQGKLRACTLDRNYKRKWMAIQRKLLKEIEECKKQSKS